MGYCGCYRQKQSYETLPSSLQTWQWTIPHFWRTFAMENPHSVHGFPQLAMEMMTPFWVLYSGFSH